MEGLRNEFGFRAPKRMLRLFHRDIERPEPVIPIGDLYRHETGGDILRDEHIDLPDAGLPGGLIAGTGPSEYARTLAFNTLVVF